MAVDSLSGDSVFDPSADRVSLPSSRIYYTLTSHEWYARGQPLLHEGRPYEPEGMPVDASLSDMQKLGDFQGVEYYSLNGDSDPVVYVPVFDGWWQRFRADPSAAPVDTTTVGITAPDSTPDGD